jgi:phosphate transport system protein
MPTVPEGFTTRTQGLLAELVEQSRRVLGLVELSFDAVFARDAEKSRRVAVLDDEIDRADVAIERTSVQLLTDATRQGAQLSAEQLREVLTIVKVNNEMERIADVGVDVAELTQPAVTHAFPDTFRVMANSVIGILRDTGSSFMHKDPALAKVVLQSQHTVTEFKKAILRDCEGKIAKGTMPLDFAFTLHEIANLGELLADHCANIAEQVIYLRTGAIVRHTETSWVEIPKPAAG